jgi:hypothetical protein
VNFGKLFFYIALTATSLKALVTTTPLLTFSPYLVYHLMHSSLVSTLGRAALIGFFLDCFSSFLPFGFYILVYPAICALLYRKRALLFGDKPLSLPLYTFVFSLVFSLVEHFYLSWTQSKLSFNIHSICTEFILAPFLDSACAFLFFTLPSWIIVKIKEIRL